MQSNRYEYFAFISYKREDEKWARWLQRKLEYYKLPTSVRRNNPELPDKIRPVFKDTTDLEPGVLAQKIQDALDSSKFLIVICSPRSANSVWVSKEVKSFISSGRENQIIPFIIGGTPNASDPKDECFPEGLRELAGEKELLGANINEMGRDAAAIKVVARMFNLRFDTLWQRYEKDKRRNRWLIGAVASLLILVSLAVAGFIANQNIRLEQANDAIRIQRDSIQTTKNELVAAYDSIYANNIRIRNSKDSLTNLNQALLESNKKIMIERDNVRKEAIEKTINSYKLLASLSINNKDISDNIDILQSLYKCTNSYNKDNPYISDIIYAINRLTIPSDGEGSVRNCFDFSGEDVMPDKLLMYTKAGDLLFIGTDKNLYSLRMSDGSTSLLYSGIEDCIVNYYNNKIALLNNNGIIVIDPEEQNRYQIPRKSVNKSQLLYVDNNHIALCDNIDYIYCIDYKNNRILWEKSGAPYYQSAFSDGICAIATKGSPSEPSFIIRFYDMSSGLETLGSYGVPDVKFISMQCFDPTGRMLSFSDNNGHHILNLESSTPVYNFKNTYAPFFYDNSVFTCVRHGNEVVKYNLDSGEKELQFSIDLGENSLKTDGRKLNIRGVNSNALLCVTSDRANSLISLWSIISGKFLSKIHTNVDVINSYLLCNDCSIITTDDKGRLIQWDTGIENALRTPVHSGRINDMAISESIGKILTVSEDSTAILSDLNGKTLKKFKLNSPVEHAVWHEKTKSFIIGTSEGKIHSIDPVSYKLTHWPEGHTSTISSIEVSKRGDLILTSAMDNTAKVWNKDKELLYNLLASPNTWNYVARANFGHNNKIITANWNNKSVTITDFADPDKRNDLSFDNDVMRAFFINDDNCFAVLSDANLSTWEIRNNHFKKIAEVKDISYVKKIPNQNALVCATAENEIIVYDKNLKPINRFNMGMMRTYDISFDSSGQNMLLCTMYGDIYQSWVLDSKNLSPIISYKFNNPPYFGRISDNGYIYYAMFDGTIRKYAFPSYNASIKNAQKALQTPSIKKAR